MSNARPFDPPRISPLLFWAILASTVGVWGGRSLVWLLSGRSPRDAFSDAALWWLVGFELLLASVWWTVLRRRGWNVHVVTVRATAADPLRGLALYLAAFLSYWLFYDVLRLAAPQFVATAADAMRLGGTVSWPAVIALCIVNPVVEEFLYLGFLANLLRPHGTSVALSASVLARVIVHVYQGPLGALSNVPFGLVLGGFYLSDRRLWPVVVAHGLADLAALGRLVGS